MLNPEANKGVHRNHSQPFMFIVEQETRQRCADFCLPRSRSSQRQNEATGRLGFCKPARDVLTASAIAVTTWSCPTTRARSASSIYYEDKTDSITKPMSLRKDDARVLASPFRPLAGFEPAPVARATTRAISLEVTRSWMRVVPEVPLARSVSEGN